MAVVVGIVAALCMFGVALVWLHGVRRWQAMSGSVSLSTPTVAVIVVARNEEKYIEACLTSILDNLYPAEKFEVILVDDRSTDRTRQIAESLQEANGMRLTVLTTPDRPEEWAPKKRSIAFAAARSNSEIVLLTDADTVVPKTWIRSMVSEFGHETGAVAGGTIPPPPVNLLEAFYRFERLFVNYTICSAVGWRSPAAACGQNLAYRRTALRFLSAFPHPTVPSGDDDLVVQAISAAGWEVKFASSPESVVTDCRVPELRRNIDAAIRHQSVTKYYPTRWRLIYGLSIASYALMLSLTAASAVDGRLLIFVIMGWIAKLAVEVPVVIQFCRRLSIAVAPIDLVFSELILPFYVVLKPVLALIPSYSWKFRRHVSSPAAS